MTKAEGLKLVRKLLLLVFLATGFGVITSTDVTPTASANVVCCYCTELYGYCVSYCNAGQPAYGCSSNCEYCCRYQAIYIPHCYANCIPSSGWSCGNNEDCPVGSDCIGGTCRDCEN